MDECGIRVRVMGTAVFVSGRRAWGGVARGGLGVFAVGMMSGKGRTTCVIVSASVCPHLVNA